MAGRLSSALSRRRRRGVGTGARERGRWVNFFGYSTTLEDYVAAIAVEHDKARQLRSTQGIEYRVEAQLALTSPRSDALLIIRVAYQDAPPAHLIVCDPAVFNALHLPRGVLPVGSGDVVSEVRALLDQHVRTAHPKVQQPSPVPPSPRQSATVSWLGAPFRVAASLDEWTGRRAATPAAICLLVFALLLVVVPPVAVGLLEHESAVFTSPFNAAYHHMLLAVYLPLAACSLYIVFVQRLAPPLVVFTTWQAVLLLSMVVTNAMVGTPAAASWWACLAAVALTANAFAARIGEACTRARGCAFSFVALGHTRGKAESALSCLFIVFGLGIMAGPALSPWDRPAAYVRWIPKNTDDELIWRGVFACLSIGFVSAALSPDRGFIGFTRFIQVHSASHALTMLVDNLRDLDGNGNPEHLYGDILAWAAIAAVVAFLGPWRTRTRAEPNDVPPALVGGASEDG